MIKIDQFLNFVILFTLIGHNLQSQGTFYNVYNYNFRNGLNFGVSDMAMDNEGYLWVSDGNNLARFNGREFSYYNPDDSDITSRPRQITDLISDKNGGIWVGSKIGIHSYSKLSGFKLFKLQFKTKPFENISGLYFNNKNLIWCGNDDGQLILYDSEKKMNAKEYSLPRFAKIKTIVEDKRQQKWIATDKGLYVITISDEIKEVYTFEFNNDLIDGYNFTISQTSDKLLTINYRNKILSFDIFTYNLSDEYTIPDKKFSGHIYDFWYNKQIFTIITDQGIYFYYTLEKTTTKQNDNLYNQFLTDGTDLKKLFITSSQIAFIGTSTGLSKIQYTNEPFRNYSLGKNYYSKVVFMIDNPNSKPEWIIVTDSSDIFSFKVTERTLTKLFNGNKFITHAFLSKDAKNLFTFSEGILYKQVLGNQKTPSYPIKFLNTHLSGVVKMDIDSSGIIWILDKSGFYYFDAQIKKLKQLKVGLKEFLDFEIFSDGTICVCGDNLYCTSPGKLMFHKINIHTNEKIYIIESGVNDDLYLAGNSGLYNYSFKTEQTKKFNLKSGLLADKALGILRQNDKLWITFENGMQHLDINKQTFTNFNFEDGLAENNCAGHLFNLKGNLLAIGKTGYFTFYRKIDISPLADINFTLESVALDDKIIAQNEYSPNELIIPPHSKKIDIQIGYPIFLENSYYNVQYRLLYEKDSIWYNLGKDLKLSFYELKPNSYQLELRVFDKNIPYFLKYFTLKLIVEAPFYKKLWFQIIFYFLALCLSSLILWVIYKYKFEQIRKIEALRLSISRDLHDEMGSELSYIKFLSELEILRSKSNSNATFWKIAEKSSQIMESMSDIIWSINPENDEMVKIIEKIQIYAYDSLEQRGIRVIFDVDTKVINNSLSLEKRRHFYLIFKEAINNIGKYSLATEVKINIFADQNFIISKIHDNGQGFDIHKIKPGNGLKNMKERAELINGLILIESTTNGGTKINLKLPIL